MTIKVVRFRARFRADSTAGLNFAQSSNLAARKSCWSLLSKKELNSVPMLIAEISLSENAERLVLWTFMHYKYLTFPLIAVCKI